VEEMTDSILPLSYRKGTNYWSVYASSGLKLFTINMNLAEPEKIVKLIVDSVNKSSDS
jgi:uncharacterized membrane protein